MSICFEPYGENGDHVPRILPCHCTLCEACIKSLLNDEVLQCAQDRKIHKAEKGVMSFSQNKYIIAHLKKETKAETADYDECLEHKLKKILYCAHPGCKKAICPLCMSDDHLTHEVVNVVAEKKKHLFTQVETLTQKLTKYTDNIRCGSRIWSRGGPQVLRLKVADVAKRSCASEASNLRPGSRAHLRALEAFGFLMLKYAFSPHSRDSFSLIFDIYFNTKS